MAPLVGSIVTNRPSSDTATMRFDYKPPSEEYNDAINFDNFTRSKQLNVSSSTANVTDDKSRWKKLIRQMNDNRYIYPSVSILAVISSVLTILTQKSINWLVKVIVSLFAILFIVYTVFQFRDKVDVVSIEPNNTVKK